MGSKLDAVCPYCGFHYRDLRTGLTYKDVYDMLWVYDEDPSRWRYKRRHTVLGKWYQIKQGLWYEHLDACEAMAEEARRDVVPF